MDHITYVFRPLSSVFTDSSTCIFAPLQQPFVLPLVPSLAGDNLPINLTQIAHDLDAKLLEFTLMAKAREKVAEEAHTAAEAEKGAWKEEETKRVEEMVRAVGMSCMVYALTARGFHLDAHADRLSPRRR